MKQKISSAPVFNRFLFSGCLFAILLMVSGCADTKTVRFKIDSVPKGAHVLYQVAGGDSPCRGQWLYLGSTPLQGVRQLSENEVEDADKIILKVFHNGYHDQVKEWDGAGFWQEVEERDVIFWAPELISNPKER
ncbi:MAG TPA: hypothetical protein EYP35_07435 [Desulfobacterales bacterium]|nr:hypothetical protein [Desulfobacterales bacterium]HIP40477.1 hypothetical protein [Desulfocapsa sulfexigens]